jgi:hypothetical protein
MLDRGGRVERGRTRTGRCENKAALDQVYGASPEDFNQLIDAV